MPTKARIEIKLVRPDGHRSEVKTRTPPTLEATALTEILINLLSFGHLPATIRALLVLPPQPRRPVDGWRASASRDGEIVAWELHIAPLAKTQQWHAMTLEVFMLPRGRFAFAIIDSDGDALVKAYPDGAAFDTFDVAQLAAEDAAATLFDEARAVLPATAGFRA